MGLQDAERGQMGITRVQVIVLHTRVPEEQLKESQKQVQEKERSGDREKSRKKMLLPKGVQNHHVQLSSQSYQVFIVCPKGRHVQMTNLECISSLAIYISNKERDGIQ